MTLQAEGVALPGAAERRRPAPGLIVEMVGPAAAGKSTLAAALVEALRREGCDAVLEASARPAERARAARPGGMRAAASRAAKIAGLARRGAEGPAAAAMLEALPPASGAWALRYRGYLDALERRWRAAAARPGIAVFDQGFVSAVATLAALGRDFEPAAMARALAAAPAPDLVVRIDAPREALAARLRSRLAGQSFLERLLEL
ncbi:MAG: AAA family ATPase, partial [Pseudomonadota bacterium]